MDSIYNLSEEGKSKLFQEITDCFVGQKASLFAYSPSFQELYILVEKGDRYFLVRFMESRYLKVCKEWNFAGLKIELQSSKIDSDLRYYKIYDRHYLEVSCLSFWVFEILEGKDVVNASINRENGLKFTNKIKNNISPRKITDGFPRLNGAGAYLFRYDRWDKLLILGISGNNKQGDLFLACYNCEFIEYDGYINIDKLQIIEDTKIIILKEASSKFLLRCTSVEIWNRDEYNSYDSELDRNLLDKRYGVRKAIMSVKELPEVSTNK